MPRRTINRPGDRLRQRRDPTSRPGNVQHGPWGSVEIESGAVAVIDEAKFRYGGGFVHTSHRGRLASQSVLTFASRFQRASGTHAYITNNDFFDNHDAPMQIDPNGLLAGDPLHPLASGNPFFRGNVMQGTASTVWRS